MNGGAGVNANVDVWTVVYVDVYGNGDVYNEC